MKIKFFTLLAAFAFALGAAADDGDVITVDYVNYTLGGDTAVVSGLADGFDDYMNDEAENVLFIPQTVSDDNGKEYTVTTIGPNGIGSSDLNNANESIVELYLSANIKYIKEYGLANLNYLEGSMWLMKIMKMSTPKSNTLATMPSSTPNPYWRSSLPSSPKSRI